MENQTTPQPLDTLMTKLNLSNADLVKASTEQLSFKNVQKGRKGIRLSLNIQEKIQRALLAAKPGLVIKRRDLFRYDLDESVLKKIHEAMALAAAKKVSYPQLVDLLAEAGITRYAVEVGANRITFYGTGGEAYVKENAPVSQSPAGPYNEGAIRAAIADTQKGLIDYPVFLKRIHEAGIETYETNIRERRIVYRGSEFSYKEAIPAAGEAVKAEEKKAPKAEAPEKPAKSKKAKKPMKKAVNSLKARKAAKKHRVKRRR